MVGIATAQLQEGELAVTTAPPALAIIPPQDNDTCQLLEARNDPQGQSWNTLTPNADPKSYASSDVGVEDDEELGYEEEDAAGYI